MKTFSDIYDDPFEAFMRKYQRDQTRANNLPKMGGLTSNIINKEMGGPSTSGFSASEQKNLNRLETRRKRLQPVDVGTLGGGAIPGNPYSIDDRALLSGLGQLATGIINKKREKRLGDIAPEIAQLQSKKEAAQKAVETATQKKTNPLHKVYIEQGMHLITQGHVHAGIKALEKGGLDQSGILEALPPDTPAQEGLSVQSEKPANTPAQAKTQPSGAGKVHQPKETEKPSDTGAKPQVAPSEVSSATKSNQPKASPPKINEGLIDKVKKTVSWLKPAWISQLTALWNDEGLSKKAMEDNLQKFIDYEKAYKNLPHHGTTSSAGGGQSEGRIEDEVFHPGPPMENNGAETEDN